MRTPKITTSEFVEKARQVHGEKYDYSKLEYKGTQFKVCIICPIHGEFWQKPYDHLRGCGCRKCGIEVSKEKQRLSDEEFLRRMKELYKDKYDFSSSVYINTDTKIKCMCHIHGEFWQTPHHLLNGVACERCGRDSMSNIKINKSSKNFEKRARAIHGNKYDYSKVEYKHNQKEICIICPEHGEFWQKPMSHLIGCGCPKCNCSKLEKNVRNFLAENKIKFEEQKTFEWLKLRKQQYLDFYLPEYNIAIECQGKQHFKPVKYFGGKNSFLKQVERDKRKNKLCKENGIDILFFSKEDYPGMITNLNDLKEEIYKKTPLKNTIV